MDTTTVVVLVLVLAAIAVIAGVLIRTRRSRALRERFGPEYERAVVETGARRKAEAELSDRAKRVKQFDLHPLEPTEADRFVHAWKGVQARFVDDPPGAITKADTLITELMAARGYPASDFEQRAADLSVDHGELVHNYRIAHQVALRHGRGQAGTEDLRQAMIHYRELFAELIEEPGAVESRRSWGTPASHATH